MAGSPRAEPERAAPRAEVPAAVALDELGERLLAACRRGGPAPSARFAADEPAPLPFAREGEPAEERWVRRLRWPLEQPVGAVPLAAARAADPSMLALLGLTPALAGCRPDEALYLDAETTGLGGTGSVAFLIGLAHLAPDGQAFVFEQLFLPDLGCEAPLLEEVRRRLARAELIVTYNGKSFDLPLLQARCVMNGLAPLPQRPHLDLLHLARRVHRHRTWPKSLASIERQVLQCPRQGDVAGADVAERYNHYLRTGDGAGLHAVLDHNEQDVSSLVALLGLYGEPLEWLAPEEFANVARVAKRAHRLELAARFAETAVSGGGGALARRARAEIAKARGDKQQALSDFEALAAEVDDAAVRLELCKLYEHYLKEPWRALPLLAAGTTETDAECDHRRRRLERKVRDSRGSRGKPQR